VSIAKTREAGYRLIARAMLGEPFPDELGDEAVAHALLVVLGDKRTRRTAAERSLQQFLAASLVVQQFLRDPGAVFTLGATHGSVLDELFKPGEILDTPGGETS
jgi:hypothetical protein